MNTYTPNLPRNNNDGRNDDGTKTEDFFLFPPRDSIEDEALCLQSWTGGSLSNAGRSRSDLLQAKSGVPKRQPQTGEALPGAVLHREPDGPNALLSRETLGVGRFPTTEDR